MSVVDNEAARGRPVVSVNRAIWILAAVAVLAALVPAALAWIGPIPATAAGIVGVVAAVVAAIWGGGRLSPASDLAHAARILAAGGTASLTSLENRNDEFGLIARSMSDIARRPAQAHETVEVHEAANQNRELEVRTAAFEDNSKSFVESLLLYAGRIQRTAEKMGSRSGKKGSRSMDVSDASDRVSSSIEDVASSVDALSVSIAEIGQQTDLSSEIVSGAVTEARTVSSQVAGLAEATGKIGDVVALIDDIADRTNLLALNATIEAARAGEAGKGFAVVAAEVKNLANQTVKATEKIANQIAEVQSATQSAVTAIEGISATIERMSSVTNAVAEAVERQREATEAIARNTQSVTQDAAKVSGAIVDVTRSAAASYGSAISVLWAANDLKKPADGLMDEVRGFLADVRAEKV